MEGVRGTESFDESVEETSAESVFMERVGRRIARGRFEAGGRREGDVMFVDKERPVGILRVGGRNEGLPPLAAIVFTWNLQCTDIIIQLLRTVVSKLNGTES